MSTVSPTPIPWSGARLLMRLESEARSTSYCVERRLLNTDADAFTVVKCLARTHTGTLEAVFPTGTTVPAVLSTRTVVGSSDINSTSADRKLEPNNDPNKLLDVIFDPSSNTSPYST